MDQQLVDDLKGTRRVLGERGWCQNDYFGPGGTVCLDAAVAVACGWRNGGNLIAFLSGSVPLGVERDPRAAAVLGALVEHLPDAQVPLVPDSWRVYTFNDLHATTVEDCYTLIDKALADAGGLD